ncbi:MAG: hypothetical protein JO169_05380 [Solirubrobacterales bacterium]|nr:hypothetical protein [Solirubrobacterales bacterium]
MSIRKSIGGTLGAITLLLCVPAIASASNATPTAPGNLASISCPNAALCYAVGDDRQNHAVFDTIVSGRETKSQKPHGAESYIDVSCVTKSFCLMTADLSNSLGGIQVFSKGSFGKAIKVRFSAWRVSCPASGRCVIAGFSLSSSGKPQLAAADFVNGKLGPVHTYTLGSTVTSTAIYGISCVSISSCEMVGTADVTTSAGIGSVYAKVGSDGKIQDVHVLGLRSDPSLENGIACANGSCYVGASTETSDVLLSLKVGGAKLTRVAVPTMLPLSISCTQGLKLCTAAGAGTGAVPAIQSFVNGQPRPEQDFPNLQATDALVGFAGVARSSPGGFVAIATEAGAAVSDVVSGAA